jgi:hypothetical protein
MGKHKFSVSSERSVHTYGYLRSAAEWALEQAEGTEEGRFYNCMISIILSAFCIEGYLNHIGSELLPYWDEEVKRDLSVQNKLKIICHHLNIAPDYSRRPFQSFRHIVKYRNLLAHAITEKVSEQGTQIVRDGERMREPKTWWEKHTNLQIAKRWLADTESMITEIHKVARPGDIPFGILSTGIYSGTLVK